MKTLFLMISFLTRIPVPQVEYTEERYGRGIKLFPFIGLLLGILLYVLSFACRIFGTGITAALLLAFYVLLTGGLHLDGLADTCDGLFSGRDRERKLQIMRDSFIGTFGVLSLTMSCIFYFALFTQIPYKVLILFPVIGKTAPILSCLLADYVRPSGLGKVIAERSGGLELTICLVVIAGLSFLMDAVLCLLAGVLALTCVLLVTLRLKKSIGGITGDTLGMVCELSQIVFLIGVCGIRGIGY